jgi:hypothetical protein
MEAEPRDGCLVHLTQRDDQGTRLQLHQSMTEVASPQPELLLLAVVPLLRCLDTALLTQ